MWCPLWNFLFNYVASHNCINQLWIPSYMLGTIHFRNPPKWGQGLPYRCFRIGRGPYEISRHFIIKMYCITFFLKSPCVKTMCTAPNRRHIRLATKKWTQHTKYPREGVKFRTQTMGKTTRELKMEIFNGDDVWSLMIFNHCYF